MSLCKNTRYPSQVTAGLPHSSAGKESTSNVGGPGSIPGLGRSTGEGIGSPLQYSWASLVAQLVESTFTAGDLGLIPGLGRSSGEGKGYPPVFWPGEFHGLYPWACKEWNMTERLPLWACCRKCTIYLRKFYHLSHSVTASYISNKPLFIPLCPAPSPA